MGKKYEMHEALHTRVLETSTYYYFLHVVLTPQILFDECEMQAKTE